MSLNINYTTLKKAKRCGTEKEVQTWEWFFLYTSLFRAGVAWLTSEIASLLMNPSDRMAYSSFPQKDPQTIGLSVLVNINLN